MMLWEQGPNQTTHQSPVQPRLGPPTALAIPAAHHRDNIHSLGDERERTVVVLRKKVSVVLL